MGVNVGVEFSRIDITALLLGKTFISQPFVAPTLISHVICTACSFAHR